MSITKICKECGKSFQVPPSHDYRKYCSKECFGKSMKGMPNPKRSRENKGRFKGKDNPNFKGDSVSYGGIHRWVYRNIPKPTICPRCGKAPVRGRIEAHNKSGKYLRDPDDWEYLCTACHQEIDGRTVKNRERIKELNTKRRRAK